MITLIGLAGGKGVGKTTVAETLQSIGWERLSFAWALKEMLTAGFGIDFHAMSGEEKEKPLPFLDVTPRHLMQTLGTEWGRNRIAQDIWIKLLKREIEGWRADAAAMSEPLQIVVDDVRFDNEAAMIRALGGRVVLLTREDYVASGDAHASEQGISPALIDHEFRPSDFQFQTCADRAAWATGFITAASGEKQST